MLTHQPLPRAVVNDQQWSLPRRLLKGLEIENRTITFVRSDFSQQSIPYCDFIGLVLERAQALTAMGLKKGDRMGLILIDPEPFISTFYAAVCLGIVAVPLSPPLGFANLDAYLKVVTRTLNVASAKALVTTDNLRQRLEPLKKTVESLCALRSIDQLDSQFSANLSVPPVNAIQPDDVALLQFTSGTTAAPKGVVVTHRNLAANYSAIGNQGLELDPEQDVFVSWLPLFHDMGLAQTLSPFFSGFCSTVFMPPFTFVRKPSLWPEMLSRHRGTITFAPNFAYSMAVKRTPPETVQSLDLSCLKVAGCGAEPVRAQTLRDFQRHFAPAGLRPEALLPCYGMAESTVAISFPKINESFVTDVIDADAYHSKKVAVPVVGRSARPASPEVLEFVSCGRSFRGHDLFVVDGAGELLPERTIGEICVVGPSVARGYFHDAEATAEVFRDDGLRTGDLGYLANGQLFVTGRKKDLIILNGRNYDPQGIEWTVGEVPGVKEGGVVAFSCPGPSTEKLVIVAEAESSTVDATHLAISIRRHVCTQLLLTADEIVIVRQRIIGKTSSGKLMRQQIRADYLNGELPRL